MRGRLWRILWWEPEELGPYETVRARLMHRAVLAIVILVGAMVPASFVSGPAPLALLPASFVVLYAASCAC